jgi:hypothetical protein
MKNHKGQVMIATPSHSGMVWFDYVNSYVHSIIQAANAGWSTQINGMSGNSLISLARAICAQDFWDSDCDCLFFIDSDLRWDPAAFVRMLDNPNDVVCGIYPCRSPGQKKFPSRGLWNGTAMTTRGCQSGFLRIKRTVLEKMREAYPELRARDKKRGRWMYMLFDPLIVYDEPLGEDFAFCERWCLLGEQIYVDPDIDFGHFGFMTFEGNLSKEKSEEILVWPPAQSS